MRSRRLWLSLAWLTLGGGLTITAGPMPLEADSTPSPPPDELDLVPELATQAEISPPPPRDEEIPPDKAALPVPTQLRLISATQESVRLAWQFTWPGGGSSEPDEATRALADDRANHYFLIIYVHGDNEQFHRVPPDQRECELTGLKTHSLYEIRVKALVGGRSTPPSPPINVSTDVGQPGQPVITNVSCYDTGALSLEWERPSDFDKSVDYYRVFYRPTDQAVFEHVTVPSGTKETNMRYHLRPLVGRKRYVIKICAATRSIYNPNRTWLGEASKEMRVYLPESQCLGPEHGQAGELSIGMVLGAVGALILLALACVCYVIWKRHLKSAYYEIDDLPRVVVPMGEPQWENEPGLEGAKPGSILVENLEEHVALLHADSDFGFTKEYEEIQTFSAQETQACHLQCSHPDNKCKNRYLNIVAYDHSRVVLSQASGQKKTSDYINANYIDGYRKYNAYIGTQGPLEDTCEAFWRMVWEQNVFVIVMITNLSERGRRKCDMYWPKDDAGCSYGPFEVHLEHEKVMSNYTLRKLKLRHLKLRKKKCASGERDVLQFHYTSWPDHGVPAHPLPVLSFIKKSSESNPPDGGPIIVHCSAGVGRTGTYIAIHALLEQIRDQGQFNAFGFLKHIRKQRNHLVQTEEQYIFIHDAILEALRSGFTEIKSIDITPYIEDIVQNEEMKLQKQLQLITSFEPAEFHCTSAHKSCNVSKNRDSEIVPIESARVVLAPKPGLEGSDYINASWLHGYHRLKEFIITQHPTEDTKHEFWRMLWDHNVQTIVLLSSMEDLTEFPIFWPILDEEFDLETFRVRFIEKATHEGHSTLDFVLSSCQDDYELTVRVILCSGWPHNVKQLTEAFEVLTLVQEWHLEYQNGPMVVLDAMGGTEAATFCALTTLCQQLETEDALDVYQVAKLYHDNRPGVWKSKADILFMYKAMEALIASSHIANPVSSTVNSPAAVAILSPEPVESAPEHDTHHDGEDAIPTNITLGNGDLNGISRHLRSHSDSLANGSVKMTRVGSDSSESSSRRHSLPPVNDVESGLALEACPKPANGIVVSLPNDTQHHNHHHHNHNHDNRHRNSSAQAFSSMGRRKLEKKKQQQSRGVVPPQTDVVESATSDLPSHASLDPIGKEKVPNPLRPLKKRVISRASNNRSTDKIRSALKNPEVLRRHFPNLFKPFIIRCDGESESDEELPSNSERKSVRSHMFDQNLDQFLLESRKKSDGSSSSSSKSHDNSSKTKPPPPPKPVRRNPPGLGKGKEVHQKTTMTPETKAKLMNSSIRHLPKEKQIEYQRLKSYLTKKKKLKEAAMARVSAKEHQTKVQQAVPGTKETVVQKAPVVPNPLPPLENKNQKKTEPPTAAMSISVDENGRNIHLKEGGTDRLNGNQSREVSDDELDKKGGKKLIALEHTLIDARKDLASSLFKMSAELSQYRNEKSSRDEASKLVAELKARLKEAQDLEFKRGGQVENLRLSILNSQQILLNKKSNIQELEKKIVLRADDVLGPGYGYTLPDKYSDVIKKKLNAIATNASQIKSDLKTPAFSTNSSKSPQNPTTSSSSLPAMGSSVLAHMGENSRVPALDPHKQLCPFELSGQCNDAKCHFQHVGNIRTQTET